MADVSSRTPGKVLRIVGPVLVGVLAGILVPHFWSSGSFRPHYQLRMYVAGVAGVIDGAPVRIDGITVGSVSSVQSSDAATSPDRSIELILTIEKRYQDRIRSDSVASFMTEGLLGNRYVGITRGFHGNVLPPDGEVAAIPERVGDEKAILDVMKLMHDQSTQKNGSGDK
jgi:ABC-type transporter Mla subunit MlaD